MTYRNGDNLDLWLRDITGWTPVEALEMLLGMVKTKTDWGRDSSVALLAIIRQDPDCWSAAMGKAQLMGLFTKHIETFVDAVREEHPDLCSEQLASAGDNNSASARPLIVTMNTVEAMPIQWLWWPYIALNKLAMLDGDPGLGKSHLITLFAACLSRGYALPDQQGKLTLPTGGPHTTLLLSTEDGLADTLRPRLDAAGADPSKIHVLTGWVDEAAQEQVFTLQHMHILEQSVASHKPRLVVLDPIQQYLGDIDMHRANAVRPLLSHLARLAEREHCAIVCVRHVAKSGQGAGKAIYRGLGSIDFIGAARTGLFVEEHPLNKDKVLLCQTKSNIGIKGRTQVFNKAEGKFEWAGVTRLTGETIVGTGRGPDPHAFLEAVVWLEEQLRAGVPTASQELLNEGDANGYNKKMLHRAKKALGVRSRRQDESWFWTLPSLEIINPPLPTITCPT